MTHAMRRYVDAVQTLSEAAARTYYHGSRKAFPVGFILRAQSDGYVHGVHGDEFDVGVRRVERVLEKFRPPEMISRLEAVFLSPLLAGVLHAGGHDDFVYRVEPIGACQPSCLWWYSSIEDYLLYDSKPFPVKLSRQYAENYWNNVPPPEGKSATYEYRCREAKIVAVVKPRRR